MRLRKIINEEIRNFVKEEEYFDTKLPDDVKKHSNRYVGRNVIWYGDPYQMIVVPAEDIHGMWGNIYDSEKLQFVVDLIRDSEDYVEFECSYAIGGVVDIMDIVEHQEASFSDRFGVDYDGHERPYSIDDEELDGYLGNPEYIDDNALVGWKEINDFYASHKFDIVDGKKTKESLLQLFEQLKTDNDLEYDEHDYESFEMFIDLEERLANAINDGDGDLNRFAIQLRDGHHRVMGAIKAGENYVCVNLEKDQIEKYSEYIRKVH